MSSKKNIFVKRKHLENTFSSLLCDKTYKIWSLFGKGGVGKTAILERFYDRCQQENIPALFIDISETYREEGMIPDLAVILDARSTNVNHFEQANAIITGSYQDQVRSASEKLQVLLMTLTIPIPITLSALKGQWNTARGFNLWDKNPMRFALKGRWSCRHGMLLPFQGYHGRKLS